jgi:hypothetical protein
MEATMFGKLINGMLVLAPSGAFVFAYYRLRSAASARRLTDARLMVSGDPIR